MVFWTPLPLALLADSLEGLAVLFDTHELARLCVALRPLLGGGVVDLTAVTRLPLDLGPTIGPRCLYTSDPNRLSEVGGKKSAGAAAQGTTGAVFRNSSRTCSRAPSAS